MSYNRTVTEFSSVRKLRSDYGGDSANKVSVNALGSRPMSLGSASLSADAAMSPHKAFFGRDDNGREAYYVQFNIGDFQLNDIIISTDGQRLSVKGKSKIGGEETNHLARQFSREFRLPDDVDPNSIKANLDEKSRTLSLVGQIIPNFHDKQRTTTTSSYSYESAAAASTKVGTVRENRTPNSLDYEIYLGSQLADGKIVLEIPNFNSLLVRVSKTEFDSNGETNLELRRLIKLPSGANAQNIEQKLGSVPGSLLIKVPLR